MLDAQPQNGKQLLVQNRVGGATTAQFAVRDWILPFLLQFTDLLKVLWTLWTQQRRRNHRQAVERAGVDAIARQVGRCIVEQLSEEVDSLRVMKLPSAIGGAEPTTLGLPPSDLAIGRRAPGSAGTIGGAPPGAGVGDLSGSLGEILSSVLGGGGGSAAAVGNGGGGGRGAASAAPAAAANGFSRAADAAALGGRAVGGASATERVGGGDGGGVGWASVVRRPAAEPAAAAAASVATERPKAAPSSAAAPKVKPATTSDETLRSLVAKRESARFARDFEQVLPSPRPCARPSRATGSAATSLRATGTCRLSCTCASRTGSSATL